MAEYTVMAVDVHGVYIVRIFEQTVIDLHVELYPLATKQPF